MRSALQSFKNLIVALFWFCSTYALFAYIAHFTEIQSFLLAFVAVYAIDGYRLSLKTATNQQPKFEPFWVSIEPNWFYICGDFGLAVDDQWTEFQERCKIATADYSIVRNGLHFTRLSPTLFYSNDHQTFFAELDLRVPIEELKPESGGMFSFTPRFYVKRTLIGEKKQHPAIEFGLVTQESLKKSSHPGDDNANIPIAWLPEIVFFGFSYPDAYNWKTIGKMNKQIAIDLTAFGWTKEERSPEDSWLKWPEEIDHKYMKVRYRGLS